MAKNPLALNDDETEEQPKAAAPKNDPNRVWDWQNEKLPDTRVVRESVKRMWQGYTMNKVMDNLPVRFKKGCIQLPNGRLATHGTLVFYNRENGALRVSVKHMEMPGQPGVPCSYLEINPLDAEPDEDYRWEGQGKEHPGRNKDGVQLYGSDLLIHGHNLTPATMLSTVTDDGKQVMVAASGAAMHG